MNHDDEPWVRGALTGLEIPATSGQLRAGGVRFLTDAFQNSGMLTHENRVAHLTSIQDFMVGGTGSKASISVVYEQPLPHLPSELFVKFSRNFADRSRDNHRQMMESEVKFASLASTPGFPIVVPTCMFADYHPPSGNGLLITERIAYGRDPIEDQHPKCLDYRMPHALQHYRAIIRALARLAGAHRAGRLAAGFDASFPFDLDHSLGFDRIPHSEESLLRRVNGLGEFAAKFPGLVPASISTAAFAARLSEEIPLFLRYESRIRKHLATHRDLVALCHWNANIDNAWFWKDEHGELECGLMDWARVAQMPLGFAVLGAFSGAEPELWRDHLDELLQLFLAEYAAGGGPHASLEALKLQLHMVMALGGLAHLMAAPAILQARLPDLASIESRFDPRLASDETARVQLHMLCMFLGEWHRGDFGCSLKKLLQSTDA